MIISDLNYWEAIQLETNIVGGMTLFDKVDSFTFDKDVALETNIEFDVTARLRRRSDRNITSITWSGVNIDGNFGSIEFDATASGENSVAEADVSLFVTENLVEASGSLFGAVS